MRVRFRVRLAWVAWAMWAIACGPSVQVEPRGSGPSPVVRLAPRGATLRIASVGDIGDDRFAAVAAGLRRRHAERPFDAVVVPGDNFYPCGAESIDDPGWQRIREGLSTLGVPIFPVLGNHDYGNPSRRLGAVRTCGSPRPDVQILATRRIPKWTMPARSYRVESPVADILLFDTTPVANALTEPLNGSETAAETLARLTSDLRASRRNRWRIVAGHHSILSSAAPRSDVERMRASVLPILEREGVDLYLCGHDHHLELIEGASEGQRRPIFVVSGAGSRLRSIRPAAEAGTRTLFPPEPVTFNGFAVLEISSDELGVSFFDASGMPRSEVFRFKR